MEVQLFLLLGPILLTFCNCQQQKTSSSTFNFPCTSFRDCNPNERCLEEGFCDCKFGYTKRKPLNRKFGRNQSFQNPRAFYCARFTCTNDVICERKFGNYSICRDFACTCKSGAFVDFATQKCTTDQNRKLAVDGNTPAWIYWIWKVPEGYVKRNYRSSDEDAQFDQPKTVKNHSEIAFKKCSTTAQCELFIGLGTVCSPSTFQCELRAQANPEEVLESGYYWLLRWAIIGAIILSAVFCVCRSSFSSSSPSSSSDRQ